MELEARLHGALTTWLRRPAARVQNTSIRLADSRLPHGAAATLPRHIMPTGHAATAELLQAQVGHPLPSG